jgi:hypothetical protein
LDSKWIQVIFEAPELKVGSLGFQYGGESEVKLEITYVDEKIRLGKGSRGSLFVFLRQGYKGMCAPLHVLEDRKGWALIWWFVQ